MKASPQVRLFGTKGSGGLNVSSVSSIEHCLTRNTQILKAGASETTKIHRLRSSQYKLYPLVRKKGIHILVLAVMQGHWYKLVQRPLFQHPVGSYRYRSSLGFSLFGGCQRVLPMDSTAQLLCIHWQMCRMDIQVHLCHGQTKSQKEDPGR